MNYKPCCDGHAIFNSDFHTVDCMEPKYASQKDFEESEPTEAELRRIEAENEKNNDLGRNQFFKEEI